MHGGRGKTRKPRARARARHLRKLGWPYKRIAAELKVSPSSVFNWASDIALTPEQIEYNPRGPRGPQNPELIARRQPASDISSGLKRNRLPDGVGNLSHCSTAIVQHIFGAIQEYAGFEEPRWLG